MLKHILTGELFFLSCYSSNKVPISSHGAADPWVCSLGFLPPASNISLSDMQCGFCKCIVDQPVNTLCRKLAKCISDQVRASNAVSLHCPSCSSTYTIESTSYTSTSDVVLKIIGSLLVKCEKPGCTQIIALSQLKKHIDSGCREKNVPTLHLN